MVRGCCIQMQHPRFFYLLELTKENERAIILIPSKAEAFMFGALVGHGMCTGRDQSTNENF